MRAADDGIEIGQKLETVERLGEIPVGAGAKRGDLVVGAGIAEHDESEQACVLADQARKSGAVTVWKVDVEQHRVGVCCGSAVSILCASTKPASSVWDIGYNRIVFWSEYAW